MHAPAGAAQGRPAEDLSLSAQPAGGTQQGTITPQEQRCNCETREHGTTSVPAQKLPVREGGHGDAQVTLLCAHVEASSSLSKDSKRSSQRSKDSYGRQSTSSKNSPRGSNKHKRRHRRPHGDGELESRAAAETAGAKDLHTSKRRRSNQAGTTLDLDGSQDTLPFVPYQNSCAHSAGHKSSATTSAAGPTPDGATGPGVHQANGLNGVHGFTSAIDTPVDDATAAEMQGQGSARGAPAPGAPPAAATEVHLKREALASAWDTSAAGAGSAAAAVTIGTSEPSAQHGAGRASKIPLSRRKFGPQHIIESELPAVTEPPVHIPSQGIKTVLPMELPVFIPFQGENLQLACLSGPGTGVQGRRQQLPRPQQQQLQQQVDKDCSHEGWHDSRGRDRSSQHSKDGVHAWRHDNCKGGDRFTEARHDSSRGADRSREARRDSSRGADRSCEGRRDSSRGADRLCEGRRGSSDHAYNSQDRRRSSTSPGQSLSRRSLSQQRIRTRRRSSSRGDERARSRYDDSSKRADHGLCHLHPPCEQAFDRHGGSTGSNREQLGQGWHDSRQHSMARTAAPYVLAPTNMEQETGAIPSAVLSPCPSEGCDAAAVPSSQAPPRKQSEPAALPKPLSANGIPRQQNATLDMVAPKMEADRGGAFQKALAAPSQVAPHRLAGQSISAVEQVARCSPGVKSAPIVKRTAPRRLDLGFKTRVAPCCTLPQFESLLKPLPCQATGTTHPSPSPPECVAPKQPGVVSSIYMPQVCSVKVPPLPPNMDPPPPCKTAGYTRTQPSPPQAVELPVQSAGQLGVKPITCGPPSSSTQLPQPSFIPLTVKQSQSLPSAAPVSVPPNLHDEPPATAHFGYVPPSSPRCAWSPTAGRDGAHRDALPTQFLLLKYEQLVEVPVPSPTCLTVLEHPTAALLPLQPTPDLPTLPAEAAPPPFISPSLREHSAAASKSARSSSPVCVPSAAATATSPWHPTLHGHPAAAPQSPLPPSLASVHPSVCPAAPTSQIPPPPPGSPAVAPYSPLPLAPAPAHPPVAAPTSQIPPPPPGSPAVAPHSPLPLAPAPAHPPVAAPTSQITPHPSGSPAVDPHSPLPLAPAPAHPPVAAPTSQIPPPRPGSPAVAPHSPLPPSPVPECLAQTAIPLKPSPPQLASGPFLKQHPSSPSDTLSEACPGTVFVPCATLQLPVSGRATTAAPKRRGYGNGIFGKLQPLIGPDRASDCASSAPPIAAATSQPAAMATSSASPSPSLLPSHLTTSVSPSLSAQTQLQAASPELQLLHQQLTAPLCQAPSWIGSPTGNAQAVARVTIVATHPEPSKEKWFVSKCRMSPLSESSPEPQTQALPRQLSVPCARYKQPLSWVLADAGGQNGLLMHGPAAAGGSPLQDQSSSQSHDQACQQYQSAQNGSFLPPQGRKIQEDCQPYEQCRQKRQPYQQNCHQQPSEQKSAWENELGGKCLHQHPPRQQFQVYTAHHTRHDQHQQVDQTQSAPQHLQLQQQLPSPDPHVYLTAEDVLPHLTTPLIQVQPHLHHLEGPQLSSKTGPGMQGQHQPHPPPPPQQQVDNCRQAQNNMPPGPAAQGSQARAMQQGLQVPMGSLRPAPQSFQGHATRSHTQAVQPAPHCRPATQRHAPPCPVPQHGPLCLSAQPQSAAPQPQPWELASRGPFQQVGEPQDLLQAPLLFEGLRIVQVEQSHPHHKHLVHRDLAKLGSALFEMYRSKPLPTYETRIHLQHDQLKLDFTLMESLHSAADLIASFPHQMEDVARHIQEEPEGSRSLLHWMAKNAEGRGPGNGLHVGYYLKDVDVLSDCQYLPHVRKSIDALMWQLAPNDVLRYHWQLLGVTATRPIMYCCGLLGGVGRHAEDDGLQFLNALLPIPELAGVKGSKGRELPNVVEWYMDEKDDLPHLLEKPSSVLHKAESEQLKLHMAHHSKRYVPLEQLTWREAGQGPSKSHRVIDQTIPDRPQQQQQQQRQGPQEQQWHNPGVMLAGERRELQRAAGITLPEQQQEGEAHEMQGDLVAGAVGHSVLVAGGWCRLSANYATPSHLLSRLTGYKLNLKEELRETFLSWYRERSWSEGHWMRPGLSSPLLLIDCARAALRQKMRMTGEDAAKERAAFVALQLFLVRDAEAQWDAAAALVRGAQGGRQGQQQHQQLRRLAGGPVMSAQGNGSQVAPLKQQQPPQQAAGWAGTPDTWQQPASLSVACDNGGVGAGLVAGGNASKPRQARPWAAGTMAPATWAKRVRWAPHLLADPSAQEMDAQTFLTGYWQHKCEVCGEDLTIQRVLFVPRGHRLVGWAEDHLPQSPPRTHSSLATAPAPPAPDWSAGDEMELLDEEDNVRRICFGCLRMCVTNQHPWVMGRQPLKAAKQAKGGRHTSAKRPRRKAADSSDESESESSESSEEDSDEDSDTERHSVRRPSKNEGKAGAGKAVHGKQIKLVSAANVNATRTKAPARRGPAKLASALVRRAALGLRVGSVGSNAREHDRDGDNGMEVELSRRYALGLRVGVGSVVESVRAQSGPAVKLLSSDQKRGKVGDSEMEALGNRAAAQESDQEEEPVVLAAQLSIPAPAVILVITHMGLNQWHEQIKGYECDCKLEQPGLRKSAEQALVHAQRQRPPPPHLTQVSPAHGSRTLVKSQARKAWRPYRLALKAAFGAEDLNALEATQETQLEIFVDKQSKGEYKITLKRCGDPSKFNWTMASFKEKRSFESCTILDWQGQPGKLVLMMSGAQ